MGKAPVDADANIALVLKLAINTNNKHMRSTVLDLYSALFIRRKKQCKLAMAQKRCSGIGMDDKHKNWFFRKCM